MTIRRRVQTSSGQPGLRSDLASSRQVDVAAARTIDRNRRVIRDEELLAAVQRLDTTTSPTMVAALMRWIEDEFERRQGGQLIGLFGRCYLGPPYVDHRMDLGGGFIVEHFTRGQSPPLPFREARPLARSNAYAYVEVYDDGALVPIRTDGRPVI